MFLPHFSTRSESQVLQLRDAWRNWPSILEAANVVAQADSEEESARNEIFGDVRTSATSEIEIQELRANPKHAAGVVKYLYASTEDEEFDLVARLIITGKRMLTQSYLFVVFSFALSHTDTWTGIVRW